MVQELIDVLDAGDTRESVRVASMSSAPPESRHRRAQRRLARSVMLTDSLMVVAAVSIAHVLRYMVIPRQENLAGHPFFVLVSAGLMIAWLTFLALFRTRDPKILDSGYRQYQAVARASFNLFAAVAIVALVSKVYLARGYIAIAAVLGVGLLFASRFAWSWWIRRRRQHGGLTANVLVIGGVYSAKSMARRFASTPHVGFRVVGVWVPDRPAAVSERFQVGDLQVPVFGTDIDLGSALDHGAVDAVVVTDTEHLGHDGMRELAWSLEGRDVELLVAPNVVDVAGPRVHLDAHGNMPLLYLSGPTYSRAKTLGRAVFDRAFAAAVLLGTFPILVAAAIAVRLSSPGPIFYRSERVGAHGVPFRMYKLRTMERDADQRRDELLAHNDAAGPLFKLREDPRVTKVGSILRRYSIDEIPQFINVLRGEMSVVGPRPPLPVEVATYTPAMRRRLLVQQGVTGLWQVSGRSDLSWEDSVRLDLDYVENWSMVRDLQIIVRTLIAVLQSRGAY